MEKMNEIVLYDGFTMEDLFKEIVSNSRQTRKELKITIQDIASQLESITDIQILSPQIQGYMNTLVKNDQLLLKLATVVAKLSATKKSMMDQGDQTLSEKEKEELIRQAKEDIEPIFKSFRENKINNNEKKLA